MRITFRSYLKLIFVFMLHFWWLELMFRGDVPFDMLGLFHT
jgi:hypothetical protein